jgi:outer membrane protein assembly factor BamB
MVYGALSSTWPVNTGVVVEDGVAYAGAGIISYDGTHVYALDADTGAIRWQNNTSGHLNPELRAGVSVQGDAALIDGRLMLAGGNVACPAIYDLANGTCLNQPPGAHPPNAHRGSEIGGFVGGTIMLGGQRLFTDPADPISTNLGVAVVGAGVAPNKHLPGRVPPAVGNGAVAMAAQGPVVCADATEMEHWLQVNDKDARFKPRWVSRAVQSAVATAIAANAVVAVGRAQAPDGEAPGWLVAAFDLQSGRELWHEALPSAALPGGLCIDAEGRTIVVLEDGGVIGLS